MGWTTLIDNGRQCQPKDTHPCHFTIHLSQGTDNVDVGTLSAPQSKQRLMMVVRARCTFWLR